MVSHWLVKQEPTSYSWKDLERDRETEWDGVHNALALRHLRSMVVGDLGLFYHSGGERACFGILKVVRGPRPDPSDERGSWTVRVRAVRRLARPVSLAEIRLDRAFGDFDLLRNSRLSVMPVTPDRWARLLALESAAPRTSGPVRAGRTGRATANASQPRARAAGRTR